MSQQTDEGAVQHRLRGLRHLVGNAPILVIDCTYRGRPRRVFAKAEHLNMTGSIKDRMALHIVVMGRERGLLSDGAPLVEATSGNTGIAFAGVGRAMGHPVTIYMPDWMSRERVDLIRSLGAEIRLVTRDEGGFLGAIELAEKHAAERADVFLPRQFSNEDNVAAHRETTGPEIWWQLRYHGLTPDAFVAGVGTGGTIMGVGQALREMDPSIRIHPLEPASSPTLRTGHCSGSHRIQGVSDEFIPPIVDLDFLDEIVDVDDGDAILMAQRLARELGLGVGISSGANFLGALKLLDEYGPDKTIVTVFPDDNKKYLSTDLLREEPVRAEYLTPDVTLERFSAFKRVCRTCCDPAECVMPEVFASQDGELPPCPNWRGPGTTRFC
jgi:cysteine synthase A